MCIRDSTNLFFALDVFEGWTKQWLVKINTSKTTYTIFSPSTKEQKATLRINGQTLSAEDNPTYLGVTFDKRLTWKQQTEKNRSQRKGASCAHEEIGRFYVRCRFNDPQEPIYWTSKTSVGVWYDSMGHYGQVQLRSGEQGAKSGSPYHHRGHEVTPI